MRRAAARPEDLRREHVAPSRGWRSAACAARARRWPGTDPSGRWPPRPRRARPAFPSTRQRGPPGGVAGLRAGPRRADRSSRSGRRARASAARSTAAPRCDDDRRRDRAGAARDHEAGAAPQKIVAPDRPRPTARWRARSPGDEAGVDDRNTSQSRRRAAGPAWTCRTGASGPPSALVGQRRWRPS